MESLQEQELLSEIRKLINSVSEARELLSKKYRRKVKIDLEQRSLDIINISDDDDDVSSSMRNARSVQMKRRLCTMMNL